MISFPNEPKFYEKPSIQVNTEETTDEEWKVATKRKSKKKKPPKTGFCNFLSPKSYAEAAMPSSSSGSSPSSKLDQHTPPSEKAFWEAGSN
jgi:hypothetical protein